MSWTATRRAISAREEWRRGTLAAPNSGAARTGGGSTRRLAAEGQQRRKRAPEIHEKRPPSNHIIWRVLPFFLLFLGLSRLPIASSAAAAREATSRAPLQHHVATNNNSSVTAAVQTATSIGTSPLLIERDGDSRKEGVSKTTRAKRPKAKTASSSKRLSSEEAMSLRRIQSEWKDLVQAGMAYDWKRQKPVTKETSSELGTAETQSRVQPHHVWVGPLSKNLWVWHFSFLGLAGTPYEGGLYHGRLILPKNYPGSPPKVQVWTPTGRFVPRADICLSASDFHPETWTASWTVRTLIESLRLHMLTTANEIGGLQASHAQRVTLARASRRWRAAVGPPSTVVDHASMVLGGLFPAREEEEEEYNNTTKSTSSPVVAEDVQASLSSAASAQVRISDAPTVTNRESPLGLWSLLRSPLRVALLSLCLLFVVLNTR